MQTEMNAECKFNCDIQYNATSRAIWNNKCNAKYNAKYNTKCNARCNVNV